MFFLTMAFIAVWLLVAGYVFYMGRKQNSLELDMNTLEEMVAETRSSPAD